MSHVKRKSVYLDVSRFLFLDWSVKYWSTEKRTIQWVGKENVNAASLISAVFWQEKLWKPSSKQQTERAKARHEGDGGKGPDVSLRSCPRPKCSLKENEHWTNIYEVARKKDLGADVLLCLLDMFVGRTANMPEVFPQLFIAAQKCTFL